MKLLACLKIVPDLECISTKDWVADDQLHVDVNYGKLMWNCFEEGALELMLKLSDLSEGFDVVYEHTALTIGEKKSESFLKTLYALGFSECVRVQTDVDLRFRPELVSEIIANYVRETPQDFIILGTQSTDGSNQKTPALVAEQLGYPCITQVIDIKPVDETHIEVIHQEHDALITEIIAAPAVLSVGNAVCAYLRIPTLKDKMKVSKKPITCIEWTNTEDCETVELIDLQNIETERNITMLQGDTPEALGEQLYTLYLKERLIK